MTEDHRRRPASGRAVRGVCAVLVLGVLAGTQLGVAGPAAAVPKGAYWYQLWDLPNVWKISEGSGVTVAVVDSGVQASLGDLRGQVLPGLDLSAKHIGAQNDVAEKGYPPFGHGSAMAAAIAGSGKGAGMTGVAPMAKILPVSIAAGTSGSELTTATPQAIRWVVDHGAKVINMSFGAVQTCDPAEGAAIKYAYQHDVIVVASAGDSPGAVSSPADCPGAIAVGGDDINFKAWTKTPTGSAVSFVAPAYNLVLEMLNNTLSGPYPANSGTSQAAAFVSGVFALIRSKFPNEDARRIVTRALYAVHNGLGAGHLTQRINDTLGYGEIVPKLALTQSLPADAENPVYDGFDRALGLTTTAPTSGPASSAPGGSGTSSSSSPVAGSDDGSASGLPTALIAAIVVVALLVVVAVVLLLRRRGRHNGSPPPSYDGSASTG